MSKTIFYWDGLSLDSDLDKRCVKAIEQIQDGDLKSAGFSLKHFPGYKIFGADTGYGSRVLFIEVVIGDKQYIILLKELKHHDEYDILDNENAIINLIGKKTRILHQQLEQSNASAASSEDNTPQFIPVSFYDKQFIILDEAQQQVIDAQGPLLINGAAGSGKSCCSLALLTRAPKYMERILYLTRYNDLVVSIAEPWDSLADEMEQSDRVDILSYEQLVRQQVPEVNEMTLVDENYYFQWHQDYIKKYQKHYNVQQKEKQQSKKKKNPEDKLLAPFPEALKNKTMSYEAVQIAAAYTRHLVNVPPGFAESDYENLSKEQSLLDGKVPRQVNYSMTNEYMQHLYETKRVDLSLFKWKPSLPYDRVVIDEGQDLTLNMLQITTQLVNHFTQYFCCYDTRQDIENSVSSRIPFSTYMHLLGAPIVTMDLPVSYRISPCSLDFLTKSMKLRLQLNGGRVDKFEEVALRLAFNVKQTPGSYWWFDECSEELTRQIKEALTSPAVCILTIPKFVEEAKAKFGTDNVRTAKQIKGQQREVTFCYRMLEDSSLIEANKMLANPEQSYLAQSSMQHKAPKGAGDVRYIKATNGIHTLTTRAITQLIVIQPKNHRFQHIINALRPESNPDLTFSIQIERARFSPEAWSTFILAQAKRGDIDFARNMFIERLQGSEAEFERLLAQHLPKPVPSFQQAPAPIVIEPQQPVSPLPAPHPKQKSRHQRNKRQAPLPKAQVMPQIKTRTSIAPLAVQSSTTNQSNLLGNSMFAEKKPAAASQVNTTLTAAQQQSVEAYFKILDATDESSILIEGLRKSKRRSAYLIEKIRGLSGNQLRSMLKGPAFSSQQNIAILFTLEDLCLPTQDVLKCGTSLLSYLCAPYDGARHFLLRSLLAENQELKAELLMFLKGIRHVSEQLLSGDGLTPQKRSMYLELSDLRHLTTTPDGIHLLRIMNNLLGEKVHDLISIFRLHIHAGKDFDYKMLMQQEPSIKVLLTQLQQHRENEWQQLIENNTPLSHAGSLLLRAMAIHNYSAYGAWIAHYVLNLSVSGFFTHIKNSPTAMQSMIGSESEHIQFDDIIAHLSSNYNFGQEDYYPDTIQYFKSLLDELNPTFGLSAIVRIILAKLHDERELLAQLNTVRQDKRGEKLKILHDPFANDHRIELLVDLMRENDQLGTDLWDGLKEQVDLKNAAAAELFCYFNRLHLHLLNHQLTIPEQLLEITKELGKLPQWTSHQAYVYINKELTKPGLIKTGLLAGCLRVANQNLVSLRLEELEALKNKRNQISEPTSSTMRMS